jgi:N-acetyl-gamma-glutamyl-phosphate reductase/acetylglutamate kinase
VKYIRAGAWPTIFGLSGYSGAGTISKKDPDGRPTTIPKVAPESLGGGVRPYSLTDHIHEREASYHLSRLPPDDDDNGNDDNQAQSRAIKVAFVPSVAPWFSGILSTLSISLNRRITAREVAALYEERYAGEPLVRIMQAVPSLQDCANKHYWVVGGFQVHSDGDRAVVVVRLLSLFVLFRDAAV